MTTPVFSAEYWELKNPVLLKGERGLAEFYDADGHVTRIREKVGDGVMGPDRVITGTHWNDLPWIITGEQGPQGDTGPMPRHDWKGTALRFENPDGTWGERVDLKGEPGNRANAEPATTTTLGGVMPATGLRVDIEGYEYVTLGWDRHACYPDPIVVLHDDSAWLWLQKSGVGTDAGVRVPGTDAAAQYWRKVANIADIPGPGIGLSHDRQLNVYDVKYGNESGTALEGNGTALRAKKLETARTLTVALGKVQGELFDGTKDVQPGVSGILGIANGGTGTNNLASLAQNLAATGQLGGVPRLVGVFTITPRTNEYVISGLTPGHLLLWHVIANQSDQHRKPDVGELYAPNYSVDSGLLVLFGTKPKHGAALGSADGWSLISRVGLRDQGESTLSTGQNMDMAFIVGSTVRLRGRSSYDDYAEIRFYQL